MCISNEQLRVQMIIQQWRALTTAEQHKVSFIGRKLVLQYLGQMYMENSNLRVEFIECSSHHINIWPGFTQVLFLLLFFLRQTRYIINCGMRTWELTHTDQVDLVVSMPILLIVFLHYDDDCLFTPSKCFPKAMSSRIHHDTRCPTTTILLKAFPIRKLLTPRVPVANPTIS